MWEEEGNDPPANPMGSLSGWAGEFGYAQQPPNDEWLSTACQRVE